MGVASPPNFVYDFSRKIFLMLHSISYKKTDNSTTSTTRRVDRRVLRVDKRLLRVGKRVLRVGEEYYE